jgi:hypothetical protein
MSKAEIACVLVAIIMLVGYLWVPTLLSNAEHILGQYSSPVAFGAGLPSPARGSYRLDHSGAENGHNRARQHRHS